MAVAEDVTRAMYELTPGGIGLGHFNQPGAGTGQGILNALDVLENGAITFGSMKEALDSAD